jgi:hypothetical protein
MKPGQNQIGTTDVPQDLNASSGVSFSGMLGTPV